MSHKPGVLPAAAAPRLFASLRPLSLRAKAILSFCAVVVYFMVSGVVLSLQRDSMIGIVEDLEVLNQVESTLARVNTFASQTLLRINESYFTTDPRRIIESVELDIESMSAGLGGLEAWYPRTTTMMERLTRGVKDARESPGHSGILELRATMHELAADLDQLSREVRARHERMWNGYRSRYDSITLTAAVLFLAGIAVFGGIVMVFFRRLAWDVRALSDRAMDVVRGYRGEPLRVTRSDEIGALMDSVNRMQHILREREQQIEMARQQRFHQEKMVAIGSLAAAVAHEINNPIAAIEGVAQTIGDARDSGCRDGRICRPELILEHTRRIAGITRQLSQLTSPQSTEAEWIDVNAIARATSTFVTYDPRFRTVRLELDLDASIPAAWAVADHVTQSLMNLLINAADALNAAQGTERRLLVATAADADFVRLAVRDNGDGMSPEVAAHAFEEGFTTKGKGSGIGLFLCKSLVEKGGGTIALDSVRGRGTTVTVSLPCKPPEGAALQ